MLHLTNGDSAAGSMRRAGIPGTIVSWRDVLHEGPVPSDLSLENLSRIRARFLSERGCGDLDALLSELAARDAALESFREHDEVVLWFEHDLYDQLQLLQILDWFQDRERGATRLTLLCNDEYLGRLEPERFRDLFRARRDVSEAELMLAGSAWRAFRSPSPTAIEEVLAHDTSALPFLSGALRRHLEEFPWVGDGLSRSERQALEAILVGRRTLREVYRAAHHDKEERVYLGDSVFAWYLEDLGRGPMPLVRLENGSLIKAPRVGEDGDRFWTEVAVVTELGRSVLDCVADRVTAVGIDRWLGGTQLEGRRVTWRWSPVAGELRTEAGREAG